VVVQRATPGEREDDWRMVEETRMGFPDGEACAGRMEDPRPGSVRRRGATLEVLVQRSAIWCGGFEVKMSYEPVANATPSAEEVMRRYLVHLHRRDTKALAALYATDGSLLDPYTR